MTFRNQIIGLMRFSYPSKGGFSPGEEDAAQAEARLYDPARLQRRFNLFEQLTLPSLLAQADGDFRMGFLIGKGLPKPWRTRLQDAVAPLRGAKIIALDQLPHYFATRKAFAQLVSDDATHVTGFRLDDDDAIDIQHIARMRRMVEQEMAGGEPAPARDVLEARRLITDLALDMAGRGEIEIHSGSEEDAYVG